MLKVKKISMLNEICHHYDNIINSFMEVQKQDLVLSLTHKEYMDGVYFLDVLGEGLHEAILRIFQVLCAVAMSITKFIHGFQVPDCDFVNITFTIWKLMLAEKMR